MTPETKPLLQNGRKAPKPGKWSKPRLLSFEESRRLVPWATDNEFVTSGYRPQLVNISSCLYSAIGYVHNETVNIHSHSIGAAFWALMLPLHLLPSHFPTLGFFPDPSLLPASTTVDKACMACYFVCAVTCLGLSSWFHTVSCCTREVCDIAHCGDYVGIVVLIVGSILPGMYYSFNTQPLLMGLYMAGIAAAGLTSGYIVLSPHHRHHRWDRTLTFIALGLSAVVPVGHVVLSRGLTYAREMMGFSYIVAGGASYIFGAVLYAARIPESLYPGKFDYFGSSHQIFHCFVLLGSWFQFAALRWMQVGRALAV
jgi:adiponectin receptor